MLASATSRQAKAPAWHTMAAVAGGWHKGWRQHGAAGGGEAMWWMGGGESAGWRWASGHGQGCTVGKQG